MVECQPSKVKLNSLWRRLSTSKLTDFGSLLKASSGSISTLGSSNDLTVPDFVDACDAVGIRTKRTNVAVEDIVWSCILPHCTRQLSTMLTKNDVGLFEQRFGSCLAGGFVRAATLMIQTTTAVNSPLNTDVSTQCDVPLQCHLVGWFHPVAHLDVEREEQRLISQGVESTCYGRFASHDELEEATHNVCVVLTVSMVAPTKGSALATYNIYVSCSEHGFFVCKNDSIHGLKKVLPTCDQMFDDYSLELGGLFEHLLLCGIASGIFVRQNDADWPGRSVPLPTEKAVPGPKTKEETQKKKGLLDSMLSFGCCAGKRSKEGASPSTKSIRSYGKE